MAKAKDGVVTVVCDYDSADKTITLFGIDFKKVGDEYEAKVEFADVESLVEAGKLSVK